MSWIHLASCSVLATSATYGTQEVRDDGNPSRDSTMCFLSDAHSLRAQHHVVGMGIGGGAGTISAACLMAGHAIPVDRSVQATKQRPDAAITAQLLR